MENKQLKKYIDELKTEFGQIPLERKTLLEQLTAFLQDNLQEKGKADLILICTHNSRRSHFAQVWAQIAAFYYGIKNVYAYSGGTESTAMYHMAAHALKKAGLEIKKLSEGANPVYSIKYDVDQPAIIGFSKTYHDSFNVQNGFAAIMTCSHADANCPFIPTAAKRISIPYDDPKEYDNTAKQEVKYDERCRDIAREMFYVFSIIKN
ncbi:low molecular weight phosphatase family protein [Chondrinema litorale]|uniref:arsenate-mycothiol transferase ArsC n=1 Tax=Chondrinema litorale TaxID=2994555 RepID=UPI002543D5B2|nr:protein-tyrosine-phosphatase [Chondrinema litorale]UZR98937.1 protein-tyrosine-phosphatase [Chondrinema litorale]